VMQITLRELSAGLQVRHISLTLPLLRWFTICCDVSNRQATGLKCRLVCVGSSIALDLVPF
jgi:hypothetical protein